MWNQSCMFPMYDLLKEELQVEIKELNQGCIATLSVPLSDLLLAENLTREGWVQLHSPKPPAAIKPRLEIRVSERHPPHNS
ncbi:hypothetical protein XELAEV_18010600mg [Xenopus laevis]|uniref:Uncharacterized protein n=1 Tax=Xenopus laevis TaxID=8355 RepID=A0A974DUT3_XENLA|nr:hypothetical protein XELAEV_18010600mg [Xenopus laevis]